MDVYLVMCGSFDHIVYARSEVVDKIFLDINDAEEYIKSYNKLLRNFSDRFGIDEDEVTGIFDSELDKLLSDPSAYDHENFAIEGLSKIIGVSWEDAKNMYYIANGYKTEEDAYIKRMKVEQKK